MKTIEFNIFTNCTRSAPSINCIANTYESFVKTFSLVPVTVWVDRHPNIEAYGHYLQNIQAMGFYRVNECNSLSDGYVKSILHSKADFLFQLEHDWTFQNINHSLQEIIEAMDNANLYHFRFNKRKNVVAGWDSYIQENQSMNVKYCLTPAMNNNPHIIDRARYESDQVHRIKIMPGSSGIEEKLFDPYLQGAIYGAKGHPPTIVHLDGKKGLY